MHGGKNNGYLNTYFFIRVPATFERLEEGAAN